MTLLGGSQLDLKGVFAYRGRGKSKEIDIERQGDSLSIRMYPVRPFTATAKEITSVSLNGRQVQFARTDSGIEVHEGS